ncbi:MAG: methylated-DNA--[protein]-cysteine S-methyltransferase [Gammaproteobacteria bacterium]|nr:methylated-DNA--[protein]-cysteine S-methyltransferase [Gammaproteobacteria bacterium]
MARDNYDAVITSPFGALGIHARDALTCIDFLPRGARPRPARTPLAREVGAQLRAYFSNPRHAFDLPIESDGSVYQERVWRALRAIPAGRVLSYGQLAAKLASGARAIGSACRANPVPIVVPCHRVIRAGGGLGGFMGSQAATQLAIKQWLLAHERSR